MKISRLTGSKRFKLAVKKERLAIDVAAQIERVLEQRQLRKADLAVALGKSKAWVSKALHGEQNMTLGTIVELVDALDCSVTVEVRPLRDAMTFPIAQDFPEEFPTRDVLLS